MADTTPAERLGLYDSRSIVPMQSFAAGTHTQKFLPEGNSVLSTVFLRSATPGTTIQVNYWDYGPGDDDEPGSRYNLQSHTTLTDANAASSDRITVTKMHNKPSVEIIVTGGTAVLGVYISVISSFAADIDAALKKNEQLANLLVDRGLVTMGYDSDLNKYFFIPIKDNKVQVSGDFVVTEDNGESLTFIDAGGVTTDGTYQSLISQIVPAGKVWKLMEGRVECRNGGSFDILIDGTRVGSGFTSPMNENAISAWPWPTSEAATAGQVVQIKYQKSFGPNGSDLKAYLKVTEHTP